MDYTPDEIEQLRALVGVRDAIKAAGGNPDRHIQQITAYALHGKISNTEAEHKAIAASWLAATPTRYEAPATDPALRAAQLAKEGVFSGSPFGTPAMLGRQAELRAMGVI
jgi:hypothetical protein